MKKVLRAPFPYFGGKSKISGEIFKRLGYVTNYIEPFSGSLAVLLANPVPAKIETINDIDCFLANFWRAVSKEPAEVAKFADQPVNETNLHAQHRWLVSEATEVFRNKMNTDPEYYDVKIAGIWVWGMGASIPGNWLQSRGLNAMPILSSAGGGVNGLRNNIYEWFNQLQTRLKRTRVCCQDWNKLVTPAITYKNKGLVKTDMTGVFLDPPYEHAGRTKKLYQQDNDIFKDVYKWAMDNGDNPKLRIALCGYESDEYKFPERWEAYSWETVGGMANQASGESQGKDNKSREMIWFSPYCTKPGA